MGNSTRGWHTDKGALINKPVEGDADATAGPLCLHALLHGKRSQDRILGRR